MKCLKSSFAFALPAIAAVWLLALGLALAGGGCGYSVASLNKTGIKNLFIPVFRSRVYEPNLGELVTGTVVKRFQTDGSVTIVDQPDADAVLRGTITKFELSPARTRTENEKTVREYNLSVTVEYQVVRLSDQKMLNAGHVVGGTTFFVGDDLANDKRQGVSYAAEELARQLVSRVVESW